MLTSAELIELVDYVVHLVAKGVEYNGKLTLLLLHVHEKSPERGDQVILTLVE